MNRPAPAPSPTASPLGTDPGSTTGTGTTTGTTTGRAWWRRPRPVLLLLIAVVSLAFSLLQLFGGVGTLGGLLGPGAVSSSQVASEIQSRVPGGVATCSDDLTATVGATTTCSVLLDDERTDVRATVTAVDGDDVRYDLETVG